MIVGIAARILNIYPNELHQRLRDWKLACKKELHPIPTSSAKRRGLLEYDKFDRSGTGKIVITAKGLRHISAKLMSEKWYIDELEIANIAKLIEDGTFDIKNYG